MARTIKLYRIEEDDGRRLAAGAVPRELARRPGRPLAAVLAAGVPVPLPGNL